MQCKKLQLSFSWHGKVRQDPTDGSAYWPLYQLTGLFNFEKVGRAYCFRRVCLCVCVRASVTHFCIFRMVHARDLIFHIQIPHEKIFFSCPSYVPLKTNLKILLARFLS